MYYFESHFLSWSLSSHQVGLGLVLLFVLNMMSDMQSLRSSSGLGSAFGSDSSSGLALTLVEY